MITSETVEVLIAGMERGGDAVCIFDPDDRIVFTTPGFRQLYDIQPGCASFEEMMRHCHAHGTGPGFSMDIEPWLDMARSRRRSTDHRTFEIDLSDGRWLWASETCYNGGWVLLYITDITRLKTNERLLRLAHEAAVHDAATDELTGLCNRRHIMGVLEAMIAEAARTGCVFSMAIIDLDFFKQINDRFGHPVGDSVLRHFAQTAGAVLRRADIIGRIGGEEFMILMPGTPAAEALRAIDRLRIRLAAPFSADGVMVQYTISGGVACHAGEQPEELLRTCDAALYEAKRQGRNRIRLAGDQG